MKSRTLINILVVAVLIVSTWSVSACARHRTPSERADRMAGKIAKELELDDQQRIKLEAVKQEFLRARAEMRNQHEAMLNEVMTQIPGDRLDQKKLLQLLEQHQALQERLAPPFLTKLAEFHATLSPQQKAEAVERLKRFQEHLQQHDEKAKM